MVWFWTCTGTFPPLRKTPSYMSSFRIEKKKKEKEEESRGKSKARIGGNEDKKNTEKNPHIGGGGVNERREKIYSTGGRRTQDRKRSRGDVSQRGNFKRGAERKEKRKRKAEI